MINVLTLNKNKVMPSLNQLQAMRSFFESGATQPAEYRKSQLLKLKQAVLEYEEEINIALKTDLNKSVEEAWVTETGFLLTEINNSIKQLGQWMKPKRVRTNLLNFPSTSFVYPEPLGVVLIIGPWNYPLQLLLTPLVGAIAAGNCAVLKASEFAPATAAVLKKIVACFSENYVLFTDEDGAQIIPAMMQSFRFDHVFYTGGTTVGKKIYELAAPELVPVTLELGGKSPCVIEQEVDVKVAARRIVQMKFSNAGQMCVAPDYLLVHNSKKAALLIAMKEAIKSFYGAEPLQSAELCKIINQKQFDRLTGYLRNADVVAGGQSDATTLQIAPTLLQNVSMADAVMQDEIFGPILPIFGFDNKAEALAIIAPNKNPLAFYVFTSNNTVAEQWLKAVPSGGACINNAALHVTNHHLPFGGRGYSGTGSYHGRFSFNTFSHAKAVLKSPQWFDPAAKYPPMTGKLKLLKWFIK
jgi:aldehyde dehydrogenase (NAD+)